jgi:hypothetical protein
MSAPGAPGAPGARMSQSPGVDTLEDLKARGFEGFCTVAALRDESAAGVPAATGVWIVVRDSTLLPRFLLRSTGARWRGQDPTADIDALGTRWVARACMLYVGCAPGPGVRALLQQRIKRFLRFGLGRNVAHWEGRHVWQLAGAPALRVAWRVTPATGARAAARTLLEAFTERHGALPFANETEEGEP